MIQKVRIQNFKSFQDVSIELEQRTVLVKANGSGGKTSVLEERVGADGVLRLNIPIGAADANDAREVTIKSVGPRPADIRAWKNGGRSCQRPARGSGGPGATRTGKVGTPIASHESMLATAHLFACF